MNQQEYQKRMFDCYCDNCGNEISVPFKPDGKRPVYCRDCLRINQTRNKHRSNQGFGGREMSRYEEEEEYDEEYE